MSSRMMHSSESLADECQRLHRHPSAEAAPPILSRFIVDVSGDSAEYADRLRSILSPALRLGRTADFEADSVPVDDVPDWFVAVSSPDEELLVPGFASDGRDGYTDHTAGRPWELQNWLYRFDPDDDSRGWQWWDVTKVGPSRVHVWVDSWGESFFGPGSPLGCPYIGRRTRRRPHRPAVRRMGGRDRGRNRRALSRCSPPTALNLFNFNRRSPAPSRRVGLAERHSGQPPHLRAPSPTVSTGRCACKGLHPRAARLAEPSCSLCDAVAHSPGKPLPVLQGTLEQLLQAFLAVDDEYVPQAGAIGQATAADNADVDAGDLQASCRCGELGVDG